MHPILSRPFLGNPVSSWLVALGIALAVVAVLAVAKRLIVARVARVASKTKTAYYDVVVRVLDGTKWVTIFAAGIAAGARTLRLEDPAHLWIGRGVIVIVAIQIGLWCTSAARELFETRVATTAAPGATTMGRAIAFTTRLVVWSLVAVLILSNLGVEVTTLIAGLGIGGIAGALAVQNVLGELVAAFSIYVDRPFDIGDFVVVDAYMGTVDRIGWRSTQLSSISGEQIVLSNSDLARARIRNFKRMSERRVVISFGLQYDTPKEKVRRVPEIVRAQIAKHERLRFDRSHFVGLGDSALLFESVYFVRGPDNAEHMDLQQAVLLGILERFEADGISFAYPTRVVKVMRDDADVAAAG